MKALGVAFLRSVAEVCHRTGVIIHIARLYDVIRSQNALSGYIWYITMTNWPSKFSHFVYQVSDTSSVLKF